MTIFYNRANIIGHSRKLPMLTYLIYKSLGLRVFKLYFMDYSRYTIRLLNKKQVRQISRLLVTIVVFEFLFFPIPILASQNNEPNGPADSLSFSLDVNDIQPRDLAGERWSLRMPASEIVVEEIIRRTDEFSGRLIRSSQHVITAYNSDVAQCDDTPCITANGFNVCEHGIEDTVAANFLPMGTKIRIPDLFGDRIFIVRDRMNRRHQSRVDVWMKEYKDAKQFGIKVATIEVLK